MLVTHLYKIHQLMQFISEKTLTYMQSIQIQGQMYSKRATFTCGLYFIDVFKTVVISFISACLDYCNSEFYFFRNKKQYSSIAVTFALDSFRSLKSNLLIILFLLRIMAIVLIIRPEVFLIHRTIKF